MAEYTAPMSQVTKYGIDGHVDLFDKNNKPEGRLYMVAKLVELKQPTPPIISAVPIVQGYSQPMMMQQQNGMMMMPQQGMMMMPQQQGMMMQQQQGMIIPQQKKSEDNQYPTSIIEAKPNPNEIPSESEPLFFGMTKRRIMRIGSFLLTAVALGLGLGLGLVGSLIIHLFIHLI